MTARPPRILAIMGSGETAPTMARVHRAILERLGPPPVPAVLIDTPYGFQENADDISGRTMDYFRETVGNPIGVASLRSADVDGLAQATAVARIREARFVFAGPGSPSYALRQWASTDVPRLLAEKLATGGAVILASAAAVTAGLVTIPVYEVYKVGQDPVWLPGLDLLSAATGLRAAVVPHYDNAEGGTHDTRFCYMGERRLLILEAALPDGAFILGVDSHTALVLDLEIGQATVAGAGGVTVRTGGRSTVFPAGTTMTIDDIRAAAEGGPAGAGPGIEGGRAPAGAGGPGGSHAGTSPSARAGGTGSAVGVDHAGTEGSLPDAVTLDEEAFAAAVAARDVPTAVGAILALEETIVAWSRDTGDTADYDNARSVLRSLVVRLGDLAVEGARDPREAIAPFVDGLIDLRLRARAERDWATSDAIRDRLVAAGIEVQDAPDGTTWRLAGGGDRSEP